MSKLPRWEEDDQRSPSGNSPISLIYSSKFLLRYTEYKA